MDLQHAKRVALAAAYKGAGILRSHLGRISQVNKKTAIELVTEADTLSEKEIIATIDSEFHDHTILSEESGLKVGRDEYTWLIDPLDGTTNFVHQVPMFAVSIALMRKTEIVLGIVLNPISGELFFALKGQGAELNGRPIKVSSVSTVSESLLVTGFPYNFEQNFDPLLMRFAKCMKASQGVHRLGSAALDLCYVACGRYEGFWEENLKPWDMAAGVAIIIEAGGMVTDYSNQRFTMEKKEILATNGHLHQEMLTLMESE